MMHPMTLEKLSEYKREDLANMRRQPNWKRIFSRGS
jgi:hypothetical protein